MRCFGAQRCPGNKTRAGGAPLCVLSRVMPGGSDGTSTSIRGRGRFAIGDLVRVKCDVLAPKSGWGMVSPGDVGEIALLDGRWCRVRFAKDGEWRGLQKEMEHVMREAERAQEGVFEMYEHLYTSRRFEDVSFALADGEEGAHKVVLAAASDAFAAMFEQPMQECRSGKVELRSVRKATMRVFLRLLYTGRVDPQDWQDEVASRSRGDNDFGPRRPEVEERGEEEYVDAVDNDNNSNVSDLCDDTDDEATENRNKQAPSVPEVAVGNKGISTEQPEVPLEMLCEVAGLAQKYLVANLLQLAIEALKVRLQKAAVDRNVSVFEDILGVAINMGLGAVRTAAVQVAKKSRAIKNRYDARLLRPEVLLELQSVWPPPRPSRKAHNAWLA